MNTIVLSSFRRILATVGRFVVNQIATQVPNFAVIIPRYPGLYYCTKAFDLSLGYFVKCLGCRSLRLWQCWWRRRPSQASDCKEEAVAALTALRHCRVRTWPLCGSVAFGSWLVHDSIRVVVYHHVAVSICAGLGLASSFWRFIMLGYMQTCVCARTCLYMCVCDSLSLWGLLLDRCA